MNYFFKHTPKLISVFMLFCCIPPSSLLAQQQSDRFIQSIDRSKRDNTPKRIVFNENANFNSNDVQKLFTEYLGLISDDNQMIFGSSVTTKHKITTQRYFQMYKGFKVADGAYTVTIKNNRVLFMSGNFYKPDRSLNPVPEINRDDAFRKALDFVGADRYMWQNPEMEALIQKNYKNADTSYLPKGDLRWIEDYKTGTEDETDGQLHFAYCFDIYAEIPISRQLVYVDAKTGKILFSNSILKHTAASGHTLYSGVVPFMTAHVGSSYILYDSTRGNGVHTMNLNHGSNYGSATEFTSATNSWPNSAADSAALDCHWAAEKVYDYWDSVQGRLSWDNLNGILNQYVHYNTAYDNAFWDGTEMTYGDGSGLAAGGFTPLVSLDVTAHEIGHGVCQATANLDYVSESGGMNEGFSDCWGATIENWANPHETDAVPKDPWKIGEEIGGGTPLRSMSNPKLYGQPDTYLGTNWYVTAGCTPSGANDDCGVHTNSGVLNHWYYLLVAGGSGTNDIGNTFSVTGIGFNEGADILYQTELILVPTSQYADCRAASITAATTLYGACSPEVIAVTNAWYGVGIGAAFSPCVPQIGFSKFTTNVNESANDTTCSASHIVNVPIKQMGLPITGGTPTITVSVASGTAVAGVNFSLPTATTFSFAPGDTTTHYLPVTIYDNGAVNDSKYFVLNFTLNAMGSSTVISSTNATDTIHIINDDLLPETGGVEYHQVNDSTVLSNLTSAFKSSRSKSHSQFLISPAELTAAGVRANVPITQIAFKVAVKNSAQPYTAYTINMGNTNITNLSSDFITTGLTTVYTGNYTTFVGWDSIDFSTPFVWDGTSYVVVEVCFSNTSYVSGNDQVAGYSGTGTVTAYVGSTTSTSPGCSLAYNPFQTNAAKPIMRFKQAITPSKIETVVNTSRNWDVKSGQEVYFYATSDTGLIMGLKNPTLDLGCVRTTVGAAGTGFTPFSFASGVNRSVKEFYMTPTMNISATNYDATLYFTNTELGTATPSSLYIIKSDAATDAGITSGNTTIVTPTVVHGSNFVGFKGNFTGFSRFFLVDGYVAAFSAVANITEHSNSVWINSNPFHNKINIGYNSTIEASSIAQLYDIMGRTVFTRNFEMQQGVHNVIFDCPENMALGNYILKITTSEKTYTEKLLME